MRRAPDTTSESVWPDTTSRDLGRHSTSGFNHLFAKFLSR